MCVYDLEETEERGLSVHNAGSARRKRGEEEDEKGRGCQASQRVKIGTRRREFVERRGEKRKGKTEEGGGREGEKEGESFFAEFLIPDKELTREKEKEGRTRKQSKQRREGEKIKNKKPFVNTD